MYKALVNNVFGKMKGEIFDAPLHAIQAHLGKGEIEEFKELPKIESVILEETSANKEEPVVIPFVEAPKKKGRPKGWKPGQKYTHQ